MCLVYKHSVDYLLCYKELRFSPKSQLRIEETFGHNMKSLENSLQIVKRQQLICRDSLRQTERHSYRNPPD